MTDERDRTDGPPPEDAPERQAPEEDGGRAGEGGTGAAGRGTGETEGEAGAAGPEDRAAGGPWRVRRILVALDASPASRAAAATAARLAAHLRAELSGLFVEDSSLARLIPGAREVGSYSAADRPLTDDEVRRRLRGQAERARQAFERSAARAAVEGTFRVLRGAVAREVAAAAREGELLSIGRTGTSGLSRLGSVARAALSRTRGPLLLLPPGGVVAPPVVAVYGGGAAGLRTLSAAARLCRAPGPPPGGRRLAAGLSEAERAQAERARAERRGADQAAQAARGWGAIPWDVGRSPEDRREERRPGLRAAAPQDRPDRRPGPPSVPERPPELVVLLTPTDPAGLAEHEEEARIFLRETGVVPRFLHPRPAPSDAPPRRLLDRHLLTRAVGLERANVLVLPAESPLASPSEIETVVESLDCAVLLLR